MNYLEKLSSLLFSSGYFESKVEVRVLSYLIVSSEKSTVKQICKGTNIHNSKVYQALAKLNSKGLIQTQNSARPHLYFFNDPESTNEFMMANFDRQVNDLQGIFSNIEKEIIKYWTPLDHRENFIGTVFRGKSIYNEIVHILKKTEKKILFLLSPKFEPYASLVANNINNLLEHNIRIQLALPNDLNFPVIFEKALTINDPLLKIKSSVLECNTYIVSDQTIMMNLAHGDTGDYATFITDRLLVDYMDRNWTNTDCVKPQIVRRS
ncbi:MAG: TrmB family transcriptional regulator [Candidatus Kariarchaeaceae archaeon]|jgi:sugar-specific transcriptional regulator TrmB